MNTLFRAALIHVALLFSMLAAIAADKPTQATIDAVKPAPDAQLFHAREWQVDAIYQGRGTRFDEITSGGGIGISYFPWRAAGFGLEGRTFDTKHAFFDRIGFSLIGRYPIEKLRLAPEIRIGFDYDMERATEQPFECSAKDRRGDGFDVFASVGAEFRITKRLGIGGEIRGVRPVDGPEGEHVLGLIRARINF